MDIFFLLITFKEFSFTWSSFRGLSWWLSGEMVSLTGGADMGILQCAFVIRSLIPLIDKLVDHARISMGGVDGSSGEERARSLIKQLNLSDLMHQELIICMYLAGRM